MNKTAYAAVIENMGRRYERKVVKAFKTERGR